MTLTPGDPQGGYDALPQGGRRRRRIPPRLVVIGVLVGVLLLITAGSGIRGWWASRVHDLTGGSRPADFVIGLAIGLLPLLGIAIGAFHSRGTRRLVRMFVLGAIGFCVTLLLAPSFARIVTGSAATQEFDQRAPGYVPGVVTAQVCWLFALALAWWRFRRWRRTRFNRPPR